ncbi:hypothetical protein B0H11DRAFT_2254482 [Mycena galericulata]|nr:hypothetical protein B0H11DRAFT_2254482 [Mycena galericulata]
MPIVVPAILLFCAIGVRAQKNNDNNNNTGVGVGFVVAAAVLFILCCVRLRIRRASSRTLSAAPPLVLFSSDSRFPRLREYWPHPQPQSYDSTSEYPPTGPTVETAPPPYVKEVGGYAPPPGPPPPAIDASPVHHSPVRSPVLLRFTS